MDDTIYHYFDYKSPYAYLAQRDTYALASAFSTKIRWLPYTLNIPSYLGDASLDASGEDTLGQRNAHQWRRVRYSYMDCRREANRQNLVIRGPKKIFDSSVAHIGFLYVSEQDDFRRYHDYVFERFWRRELNIEDIDAITAVIRDLGYQWRNFAAYYESSGRQELDDLQTQAEQKGVFGVPSYCYRDELFWGLERLPRLLEMLER